MASSRAYSQVPKSHQPRKSVLLDGPDDVCVQVPVQAMQNHIQPLIVENKGEQFAVSWHGGAQLWHVTDTMLQRIFAARSEYADPYHQISIRNHTPRLECMLRLALAGCSSLHD